MSTIRIINDMDRGIEVMQNVAEWMEREGFKPSKWWKPENMNRAFMVKHTEPEEYFVALAGNEPAASMILENSERNQSWKSVDGDAPQKALYVHWLCVHRDFAGQGLSEQMMEYAKKEAGRRGLPLLRLDTDADEKKLCSLYERLGFLLMRREKQGSHPIAFYQMNI